MPVKIAVSRQEPVRKRYGDRELFRGSIRVAALRPLSGRSISGQRQASVRKPRRMFGESSWLDR
jgi:hypothetical protein